MESLAYIVSIILVSLIALGLLSLFLALKSRRRSRNVAWVALFFALVDLMITITALRHLRPMVIMLFCIPALLALYVAYRSLRQPRIV